MIFFLVAINCITPSPTCTNWATPFFVLDEVHRYEDWSTEIKNIYDHFPQITLLATSSSAFDLGKGMGDLSRRAVVYHLRGLSFREYLTFEHSLNLPVFTFDELIKNHGDIYDTWYKSQNLGKKFQNYLVAGVYPYYHTTGKNYHQQILNTVSRVTDIDLPAIFNIDYSTTRQVKKLLAVMAGITPFTPNISKLARDLEMNRTSVLTYLDYLDSASLIHVLRSGLKSDAALAKPDKVLIENPNLHYALCSGNINTGSHRETYCVYAFKAAHQVSTPARGDLLIDQQYTIEIGGPGKSFHLLANMPNPYLILDTKEKGTKDTIPMWMLGLFY
ncbi:MAG: ATP-binding protein [Saprospiraceae bacterium]|nr:ATP-binding protein [Saprospiraceae bacterium]